MKALKTLFALTVAFVGFGLFFPSSASAQSTNQLRMSGVTRLSDGTVQLEVRGDPGTAFVIETSPDLQYWTGFPGLRFIDWGLFEYVVQIYTLDAEGIATVVDGEARSVSTRFYRARVFP